MKTKTDGGIGWAWLRAALSRLADACAVSAAAQGGWVPPEPVQREIVARMIVRPTATRLTEVGAAPRQRPVFLFGCCGCCVA